MAPVVTAVERHPEMQSILCVTGQHRQMLDSVLRTFDLRPDADLDVMQPNQQLAGTTARILVRVDEVLAQFRPDWVLVQGDTTTVMAAALVLSIVPPAMVRVPVPMAVALLILSVPELSAVEPL